MYTYLFGANIVGDPAYTHDILHCEFSKWIHFSSHVTICQRNDLRRWRARSDTHVFSLSVIFFSVSLCGTQWPIFSTLPMARNLLWMVDWLTCRRFARTRVDWVTSSSKSSCRATSLVSYGLPERALSCKTKSSSPNHGCPTGGRRGLFILPANCLINLLYLVKHFCYFSYLDKAIYRFY